MKTKLIQFLIIKNKCVCFAAIVCFLFSSVFQTQASVVGWGVGWETTSGTNDYGQLIIPANLIGAKSIASGYWHGLAVTSSNTVAAWGLNDFGQANVPSGLTNVTAVAAGDSHSMALRQDGSVVGWGVASSDYNSNPYLNFYFGQADVPSDVTNAIAVSAGAFHSMVLKADGTVEAWGYDF